MNTIEQVQNALRQYLGKTYCASAEACAQISITLLADAEKSAFGDLTTNAAPVLAKVLGRNPREIAAEIVKNFTHEYIERGEVAGPGFINFTLTLDAFKKTAGELLALGDQFFKTDCNRQLHTPDCKKQYSIEFVSANPTGPLHLGHGRGGIIGDVLGNIMRLLGYTVTKEFYINDAGAQIKKLGNSFKIRCQQASGMAVELPEDAYHGEYLYDLAKKCLAEEGTKVLQRDAQFFEEYAKNALLQRIRETLEKYGINFDVWFSEKSLYANNGVEQAIQELIDRGHTYESEGALWFKSTAYGDDKDRVLRKSTGEYTYVASDVAYIKNKIGRGAEHLILVLGQDHHSYVVRLKGIMAALGYAPENLDVILYQLVTIKQSGECVRMSKRAGNIVALEDIIECVGTDIARFFYLHRKADAHLAFDLDLALKHTDENPVYYIQYAFVRTGSILEKAAQHPELANLTNADIAGLDVTEKLLLKKIVSLKELLHNISFNYQTHLLTYYVVELAHLFHRYYGEHRVIDIEHPQQSRARLMLIKIMRNTFALCFNLLEVNKPEKM